MWYGSKRVWLLAVALGLINGFFIFGQLTATNRFYDYRQAEEDGTPSAAIFVSDPVTPGLSPPIRTIQIAEPDQTLDREVNPRHDPLRFDRPVNLDLSTAAPRTDPLLTIPPIRTGQSPAVLNSFEGTAACPSCRPADPVGDVGQDHYVSMANFHISVFDKSGQLLTGPIPFDQLFAAQGGHCGSQNAGDPIVLYDTLADRWLLSQFAAPHHLCVAVSTSGDPADRYHTYEFDTLQFPDYFKFGVWSDGYYMSANERFYSAYVFDRTEMISGQPARFQKHAGSKNFLMPADIDGTRPPADGSSHRFYTFKDGEFHGGTDRLELYHFKADWDDPEESAFVLDRTFALTDFAYTPCGYFNLNCIPQKGTPQLLDPIAEWPMFRLAYRALPDREKMVGSFTVGGGLGSAGAAVRWFELTRLPDDAWQLTQEGTHDQDDGLDRFNPSIAMDRNGSIALGYSTSGPNIYPDIRFAVHDYKDPPGTMRRETILQAGHGAQRGSNRWGDYSAMSIDPADGCTFFYTNQFYPGDNTQWKIQVGTFALQSCTTPDLMLNVEPAVQTACLDQTAVFDISAVRIAGFMEAVELSAVGLPASASHSFSPWRRGNDPEIEQATLSIRGLAEGTHAFSVLGVSNSVSRIVPLSVRMLEGVQAPVELSTPQWSEFPAEAIELAWIGYPDVTRYQIEVAVDETFTQIVFEDPAVTKTSYRLPNVLDTNRPYYWRVRPLNECGAGPVSEIRAFLTAPTVAQCRLGTTPTVALEESFEDGLSGWQPAGINPAWHTDNLMGSHGRVATAEGAAHLSDQQLVSPSFVIDPRATSAVLRFNHQGNIEGNAAFDICWDGALVEVAAGGQNQWSALDDLFLKGAYHGVVSSNYGNPAAGKMAFCRDKSAWEEVVIDLSAQIGLESQLRFRLATDRSITFGNWSVDDVVVQGCRPDVIFTNGPTTAGQGRPGETVTLEIPVERVAVSEEMYDIEVDTGWQTTLAGTDRLQFSDIRQAVIRLNVSIPEDSRTGDRHVVTINIRSQKIPALVFSHQVNLRVFDPQDPGAQTIFVPIVQSWPEAGLPDLIIENVRVEPTGVRFDVANQGRAPVTDPFWIDGYINPQKPPTRVNETFEVIGDEGIVWGIDEIDLPIHPGERITLHLFSPQLVQPRSRYSIPFARNTVFYFQVDSANDGSEVGGVLENHESSGGRYNNVVGPFTLP